MIPPRTGTGSNPARRSFHGAKAETMRANLRRIEAANRRRASQKKGTPNG